MSRIIVVGGGASGMMAAALLAEKGREVHLYEKNEKLGKKLYITGKGRCNLTNNCDVQELMKHVVSNPRFLYSAFYSFTAQDTMAFFEKEGLALKTERGNRVFPVSDKSSDVIRTLERVLKREGVHIHLNTEVKKLVIEETAPSGEEEPSDRDLRWKRVTGIMTSREDHIPADAVIIATGGLSYPATGSTGDGFRFAEECGHSVIPCEPSLVPLLTKEDYIPKLQGLSLKNTGLIVKAGKKTLYSDFGEMMFTHNGITGPMILSASAAVGKHLKKGELSAFLDLKPALPPEKLDARILREFEAAPNKQFRNVIGSLFPSSLTPVIIRLSGISPEKRIHEITREERLSLVKLIKAFPFTITGKGEFKEAVITQGGVSVKDVNPGTMESKLVRDLYFTGEVLDLDAETGGYNLQIAWSTAYLAAKSLNEKVL